MVDAGRAIVWKADAMESGHDAPHGTRHNRLGVSRSAHRTVILGLACWSIGVGLWEWSWVAGLSGSIIGGAVLTAGLSALAQSSPDARYPVWTVTIPIAISLALLSQGVGRSRFLERTTLTGLGTIGMLLVLLRILEDQLTAERRLSERRLDDVRRQLAGEVHDVVGHTLAASMLHTSAARLAVRSDPDAAIISLERSEEHARRSMRDIHSIVHLLRDSSGAEAPVPTVDDLVRLVDDVRAGGALVTMDTTGNLDELTAAVALTLYRVVQEGLTNAVRHGTGTVQITIGFDGRAVGVRIVNDRAARPRAPSAGTGLIGMRERVEALGGELITHGAHGRWMLNVRIPA